MSKQKLELMWVGKEKRAKLEPRILIEDPEKSYHADKRVSGNDIFDNMLIHGDNLLALKALEQDYAGRVKCIYIDPPYNTGNAFEHYDDGLEHSIWLSLMRERFEVLKRLLTKDGTFFCQLSDDEMAYAKVLLDEVFGRSNFINQVSVEMKLTAGASGGGEDKRLKKNIEFILVYANDYNSFKKFNDVYEYKDLIPLIEAMEEEGSSWKYTSILLGTGDFVEERIIEDGSGDPIVVKKYKNILRTTVSALERKGKSKEDIYFNNFENIFSDTNAQTSIRTRIINEFKSLNNDELLVASYTPKSGRDKGQIVSHYYISPSIRRVIWLKDSAEKRKGSIVKREKIGTYWYGFPLNNLTKEGNVKFPNGKKPEALLHQILELATNPGDLVLDSFLGSGTTAAVAHKMGRKWIGIELGEHCDTHCVPRLKKVIDGEDAGGITKSANWRGGGGFRYYNLAPSLVKFDEWGNPVINKDFNESMLVRALCKVEGFNFDPSPDVYWKQGKSTESDFIYVTTQHLTAQMLQKLSDDVGESCTLLICCGSFDGKKDSYSNLTIKKIPKAILKKCEWNHDDYSLEIKNLPMSAPDPQPSPAPRKKSFKKLPPDSNQLDLF